MLDHKISKNMNTLHVHHTTRPASVHQPSVRSLLAYSKHCLKDLILCIFISCKYTFCFYHAKTIYIYIYFIVGYFKSNSKIHNQVRSGALAKEFMDSRLTFSFWTFVSDLNKHWIGLVVQCTYKIYELELRTA